MYEGRWGARGGLCTIVDRDRWSPHELLHHVLQPAHAAHLLEHVRVHHLGHLLVELRHLLRVDVLGHVAALEQVQLGDARGLFHIAMDLSAAIAGAFRMRGLVGLALSVILSA